MQLKITQYLYLVSLGANNAQLNRKDCCTPIEKLRAMPGRKSSATLRYLVRYRRWDEDQAEQYLNTDYRRDGFHVCVACGATGKASGTAMLKYHVKTCYFCNTEGHVAFAGGYASYFGDGISYRREHVNRYGHSVLCNYLFKSKPEVRTYSPTITALADAMQYTDCSFALHDAMLEEGQYVRVAHLCHWYARSVAAVILSQGDLQLWDDRLAGGITEMSSIWKTDFAS